MTAGRWWILGGVVVAILILLLSWLLLIAPKRDETAQIQEQTLSVQANNTQLQARIVELQQLAAALPEQQAELEALAVQLPPTADLPGLVRQLSAMAAETGVDLVAMDPASPAPVSAAPTDTAAAEPTSAGGLQQISLDVQATGPFSNLKLFLSRLETLPRAFLTTSFAITRANDEALPDRLVLAVKGAVFFVPGLPTTLPTLSQQPSQQPEPVPSSPQPSA